MVKNIFSFIVNNKRIMYFSCIGILLVFCIILNYTFSLFTSSANNSLANLTVGDLDYKMIINEVDIEGMVGTKDKSNTIIGDRILLSKAGSAEQFDISLTSLNTFDTKYEIIYNFCKDVTCTEYIAAPQTVDVYYERSNPEVNGILSGYTGKTIGLVIFNQSTLDYYVEIGLNVGYENNDLALKKQITEMFSTSKLDGNLSVIAYVDGKEVQTFPTGTNYETSVVCTLSDNSVSSARGVLVYGTNGWEINVYGINKNLTTCRVDFTTVLQVTYSILQERLKCANLNTTVADSNAVIKYTGNCTLTDDSSITGSGNWRIKFTNGGTLTFSGLVYLDLFLVGGGGGGAANVTQTAAVNGGAGGGLSYYNRKAFINGSSYTVNIGSGGGAGAAGGASSIAGIDIEGNSVTYQATGGATNSTSTPKCSFENKTSGCTYTDNGYSGLYAGPGGRGSINAYNVSATTGSNTNGTAGGGNGAFCDYTNRGNPTAGVTNTGGGGGGRCILWNPNYYWGNDSGAGGSGIIIIRNAI